MLDVDGALVRVVDVTDDEVVGGVVVSDPQEADESAAAAASVATTALRAVDGTGPVCVIATSTRGIPEMGYSHPADQMW